MVQSVDQVIQCGFKSLWKHPKEKKAPSPVYLANLFVVNLFTQRWDKK